VRPAWSQGAARCGWLGRGLRKGMTAGVPPISDTSGKAVERAATGRWWAARSWAARELAGCVAGPRRNRAGLRRVSWAESKESLSE
jgi:hypothetical protein